VTPLDVKISKILKAIRDDLLPLTEAEVSRGNHVFGGLVLDSATLETVTAGSNNRVENPIYHGEIDTLQRFYRLKKRPRPEECIFVASHEPCPMCASAIAWGGFREIWVLFDYADVKNDFGMPLDLEMYDEIFGAQGARPDNAFFKKFRIREEAERCGSASLVAEIDEIRAKYRAMKVLDFAYPS
jgi:tRNA(Arg) A34 adenosine deaminase TadA